MNFQLRASQSGAANHRLEVVCSIDGVPSTIIVDTGSLATCVEKSIGIKAGHEVAIRGRPSRDQDCPNGVANGLTSPVYLLLDSGA
jgi:hypothetical protein